MTYVIKDKYDYDFFVRLEGATAKLELHFEEMHGLPARAQLACNLELTLGDPHFRVAGTTEETKLNSAKGAIRKALELALKMSACPRVQAAVEEQLNDGLDYLYERVAAPLDVPKVSRMRALDQN